MRHSQDRPQVQRAREPPAFGVTVLEAVGAPDPAVRGLLCLDVWERWEVHTQLRSAQMRREGKRPPLWPRGQDLSVPTGPEAVTCFPSPTARGPHRGGSAVSRRAWTTESKGGESKSAQSGRQGPKGRSLEASVGRRLPLLGREPGAFTLQLTAAQGREPAVHRTAGSVPVAAASTQAGRFPGDALPRAGLAGGSALQIEVGATPPCTSGVGTYSRCHCHCGSRGMAPGDIQLSPWARGCRTPGQRGDRVKDPEKGVYPGFSRRPSTSSRGS